MKVQRQISQKSFKSKDGFINHFQRLIKDEVIPYQYDVLNDCADGAEKSHVIANFINAGRANRGEDVNDGFYGMVFQDSDAAKWIEAAAYSLSIFPDEALEKRVDELIKIIADAQDSDGYLDTYFTIKDKDKRWTNLLEAHELYCSGHMIEAACAYYESTGKRELLDVMTRNVEHIYKHFVTDKNEGYPGHPEIELALMKMYRLTNNEHCLRLCEHFINTRGVNPHFYEEEADRRDWIVWGSNPSDYDYMQAGKPVREQKDATGHAVRAVYLYTGMADLASQTNDEGLFKACQALWDSITKKRMYITGGIGSTVHGEAFSVDYDLPSDTAYAETCAAIGLMMFASRMLENEVDSRYADVMERAFYNGVLSGMQQDGKRFFYVNPLEVVPSISGVSPTHRHDLTIRPKWYSCACCPPNLARLVSSFGKYAFGENEATAFCHMYADSLVSFENGIKLECSTDYPFGFEVKFTIREGDGSLAIRIPSWSKKYKLSTNEKALDVDTKNGYAYLDVKAGDVIELVLDDTPYRVYSSPRVPRLSGQVAICRGVLVYAFEGADNNEDVLSLSIKRDGKISVITDKNEPYGLQAKLKVEAVRKEITDDLYTAKPLKKAPCDAIAIPYYMWGNRGENQMRVWLPEQ